MSAPSLARHGGALRPMLRAEARLMRRDPALVVWAAAVPVVAAVVLGAIPATRRPVAALGGLSWFATYQPVLVVFSVVLLSVQVLPEVLARYRETGVLKRLRTTPARPSILLAAQVLLTLALEVGVALVMVAAPPLLGAPAPRDVLAFAVVLVPVATSMLALGMLVAATATGAKVATAVGTALFFLLQFFAGLWVPRAVMPGWLREVSDATPSGAAVGALTAAVHGGWPSLAQLAALVGWSVLPAAVAVRFFRWE